MTGIDRRGAFQLGSATGNTVGLELGSPSEKEWEDIGRKIGRIANASAWWIGDWINHGLHKWGEKYELAAAITGLEKGTLRNYAMLCARFDLSRRYDNLTFGHHLRVASLGDEAQDAWLERSAAESWSVGRLTEELRVTRQLPPGEPTLTLATFKLLVTPERDERWHAAAEAAGMSLEDWLVAVADERAGMPLAVAA